MEKYNCCCQLTLPQCHVLLEIAGLEEATTKALSDILKLDTSTLSRTIDSLVGSALVERSQHPRDRRFVVLSLSDAGRELCDEINRRNDRYCAEVLDQIPAGERDGLIRHFNLLVDVMTAVHEGVEGAGDDVVPFESC